MDDTQIHGITWTKLSSIYFEEDVRPEHIMHDSSHTMINNSYNQILFWGLINHRKNYSKVTFKIRILDSSWCWGRIPWWLGWTTQDNVHAQLLQLCPTLCDPVDRSPPGSFVHGILQARIFEWVAMSSSRGSLWPGDRTHDSCFSCIAGRFFTHWITWEAHAGQWVLLIFFCIAFSAS